MLISNIYDFCSCKQSKVNMGLIPLSGAHCTWNKNQQMVNCMSPKIMSKLVI